MVEEILKSLSDNPEMISLGVGAVYSALTYAAGRMERYETQNEAEAALEDVYSSPFDLLKGFYDKGRKDSAQAEIELRQEDIPEPDLEELGLEPDDEFKSYWEEARSDTEPVRGD